MPNIRWEWPSRIAEAAGCRFYAGAASCRIRRGARVREPLAIESLPVAPLIRRPGDRACRTCRASAARSPGGPVRSRGRVADHVEGFRLPLHGFVKIAVSCVCRGQRDEAGALFPHGLNIISVTRGKLREEYIDWNLFTCLSSHFHNSETFFRNPCPLIGRDFGLEDASLFSSAGLKRRAGRPK